MENLYNNSLCASLTLMLFFGIRFITAPVPDRNVYGNYLRSRRIMGAALLILVVNYCVHFFARLRFSDPDAATFMNLSTYFLEVCLFGSALISLLDKQYLTRKQFLRHLGHWMLYTVLSGFVLLLLGQGIFRTIGLLSMTLWFLAYAVRMTVRLLRTYRRAVRAMDDYYSDDAVVYIRWMSLFTYWAAVFGIAVGMLTFLPEQYVFIWILSAIPFYICLYVSYMNYQLFYHRVKDVFEFEQPFESGEGVSDSSEAVQPEVSACYKGLDGRLEQWIAARGFTACGITVAELAVAMGTNRTYLTGYIKQKYGMPFREWIGRLRVGYAKELLVARPDLSVAEVAQTVGYRSSTHFIRLFSELEDVPPAKWRKGRMK